MSSWSTIQETPNQKASQIVFTAGATIKIQAPASKVFSIIIDHQKYASWNTWTPKLTITDGQTIKVGSEGKLTVGMAENSKTYEIPLKILECSPDITGSGPFALAWRGQFLPSWFGVAERVQTVTATADATACELVTWESMSGWGVYLLEFLLGVKKDLLKTNLLYANDLKAFAEQ